MPGILEVENLSKFYWISHQAERDTATRYVALRDVVADGLKSALRRNANKTAVAAREQFWALKDVSFCVAPGERIGVIGRNGAGKSTLLKVISRITEPSAGKITLRGRVASLLEVGTGFHPELTGRENIFLNGAILGMRRTEIQRKFDQIVEFAEVEKFLDTPVKRYSSGMYMRLAFGVAAHLDPEILIVDEVLAVGDAQFQKKCLGRMRELGGEGRTVLFVSHNMATITSLCDRCILMDGGKVAAAGPTSEIVMRYFSSGENSPAAVDFVKEGRYVGDEYAQLLSANIVGPTGMVSPEIDIAEPLTINMRFKINLDSDLDFTPNIHAFTADGSRAFVAVSDCAMKRLRPGEYLSQCRIDGNLLNEGPYFFMLVLSSYNRGVKVHFSRENVLSLNVRDPIEGTITRGGYAGPMPGVIRPHLEWNVEQLG